MPCSPSPSVNPFLLPWLLPLLIAQAMLSALRPPRVRYGADLSDEEHEAARRRIHGTPASPPPLAAAAE